MLAELYLRLASSSVPVNTCFPLLRLSQMPNALVLNPTNWSRMFVHALNKEPQTVPLKNLASRNLSHKYVSRKNTASRKFSRNFYSASQI